MHPDRVYHVQHKLKIGDLYESTITDLIFVEHRPVAVLAWQGEPGEEQPLVSVPLNPAFLEEFRSGPITHIYQNLIDFPA